MIEDRPRIFLKAKKYIGEFYLAKDMKSLLNKIDKYFQSLAEEIFMRNAKLMKHIEEENKILQRKDEDSDSSSNNNSDKFLDEEEMEKIKSNLKKS